MNLIQTNPKKGPHGGCGHQQPLIRKGLKLFVQYKRPKDDDEVCGMHARHVASVLISSQDVKLLQPDKHLFRPSEVYTTFKKMSGLDLLFLGLLDEYPRPEWMIITVLPVPLPPVRPSIAVNGGAMRSMDDLTYKLGDIIKSLANVRRCEQEGAPAHVITEFEQLLQVCHSTYIFLRVCILTAHSFHVAIYMDDDIAGIPQALQKSGRPVKAIRARLKGKEGRLRGNLMGKHVEISAHTVIMGDPNLELDEVDVPRSITMNLTLPERGAYVANNITYLQELVRNDPTIYPDGGRYVVQELASVSICGIISTRILSCNGWIVERHLKDRE